LEQAGFSHRVLVENDPHCCQTLRDNRPEWNVREMDLRDFSGHEYQDVDLFAAGLPCPPFSIAGKQLGESDERDLFPTALRIIEECNPRAVMIENVKGLASAKFDEYRSKVLNELERLGFKADWRLLKASDFGVPQLRPRFILVAMKPTEWETFAWPAEVGAAPTVGAALLPFMAANGWPGAQDWADQAASIGPTLVGGSKKHGGPDLGPTRAKKAWAALGVNGHTLAEAAPDHSFPQDQDPRLTVPMCGIVQGFPETWEFFGKKTAAYRQVGNAFPPPVARAVGTSIAQALGSGLRRGAA
jgi:DNA (cytosine-5)-methyltransferase 1